MRSPAASARRARLARIDPRFEAVADRLAGLEAELEDAAQEVRRLAEGVDHDAPRPAAAEERLSQIYSLERRYGDDEAAVIAHGGARRRGDRAPGGPGGRAPPARGGRRAPARARSPSRRPSCPRAGVPPRSDSASPRTRRCAASASGPARSGSTSAGARPVPTEPAIELDGDAVAFDATGADEVVFRFAPNPGEPPRPLAKIASGGELSRVALAIKQVLAAADDTPTLVFDEVDAGIGGRTADPVGRSLWALARNHQVLVVTHLPQIAAHADAHFRIAKRERDGRTITEVERLDREGQIVELAAMLGGSCRDRGRRGGSDPLVTKSRPRRRRARAVDADDDEPSMSSEAEPGDLIAEPAAAPARLGGPRLRARAPRRRRGVARPAGRPGLSRGGHAARGRRRRAASTARSTPT